MSTSKEAVELATNSGDWVLESKSVDSFGASHHVTGPFREWSEAIFAEGRGFVSFQGSMKRIQCVDLEIELDEVSELKILSPIR